MEKLKFAQRPPSSSATKSCPLSFLSQFLTFASLLHDHVQPEATVNNVQNLQDSSVFQSALGANFTVHPPKRRQT